ncbi:hypothetical protein KVV02_006576 [Mortierella alpina]|uniref:ABC transporter domain-containing protein n=1 Tax=Mortierella alpina TaxID=64518 RepID=A0A9P8A7P0_MORAP|nr:hypothetical protein KVV02_006576 [Mortierella alpina]
MSQGPQSPTIGNGSPVPPQVPSPTARHGILRNPSSAPRMQRMNSIIPPPSEFGDSDLEDDDEDNDLPELTADEAYQNALGGRWGEGPSKVDVIDAERDFRMLERTLSGLSRRASFPDDQEPTVVRRKSSKKAVPTLPSTQEEAIKQEGHFDYEAHLKENILPKAKAKGLKMRTMGVCWKQLNVIGEGVGEQHISTTGDPFVAFIKLFNPFFWVRKCTNRNREASSKKITKTILHPMDGCCEEGEMILVLGRPGSGCSTLLRVLANDRKNYKKVLGDVSFNNLSADTVAKHYKGEVLYNQEDDFHYPTLTVRQTLETAIKAKTPRARLPDMSSRKDFRDKFLDVLTKMYGLTRQKDTLVGNAFIRGVSGGERKRLSIAEQMATRSSINMWDGSTRGLDASSALDYVKSLRVSTNLLRRATMVSIYQASENIYDLFDKVLLLYDGHCIYFGPAEYARQYFIDLGFDCPARQTTADFLTAITDIHERKAAPGLDPSRAAGLPNSPEQFEVAYKQSVFYEMTCKQIKEYDERLEDAGDSKNQFLEATKQDKQKHVSVKNPYTITYLNQVWAMTIRQVQLVRGDISSLISRYVSMLILAVIVGTCFFMLPTTSSGAFTRGGVIFFSLLFNALISQAELPNALQGRPILYKLKQYAMYRPSAFGLAQVLLDIPIVVVNNLLFSIVLYFLAGLQRTAGKFFVFVLVLTLASLCMTSFFRMWGCASKTFDDATKFSGVILLALILYTGYLIPYIAMHPWFIWIFWINPLAYAFKALMSNEMSGLTFTCEGSYLIPNGPGFNNIENQVCTLAGAKPGQNFVNGPDYLYAAFHYRVSEMWINIVAVGLFWIMFSLLTSFFMETKEFGKGGFSTNVFKKTVDLKSKQGAGLAPDVEQGLDPSTQPTDTTVVNVPIAATSLAASTDLQGKGPTRVIKGSVFTWENLDYVVPYKADPSGKKQLLNGIAGLVKPGTMTALMGSSGAGKTTLLDVLAQRKSMGTITGQVEVDGRPPRKDFQRTTGYCEQLDVHVPECTVREALQFSAYLRQPVEVSKAEKDAYVEEIIHILEMEDIADAMVGTTESGLGISVEERKRLTIGVELVAKPKLLFLDEPTSGLDAQASYNIMRFMRKLTDQGQAILCTIHQPSSQLFAFFDDLLLLAKGGRTVFFGHLGADSGNLIHYFEKNGAPKCAEDANPAEYILDVVNSRHSDLDWPEIWNASPEKGQLLEDIKETRGTANATSSESQADDSAELEYATDTKTQFKFVFSRMVRTFWRLPGYNIGRLFMLTVFGLLNGFTFFRLGDSTVDLQSRVFVIFQILVMAPLLCNTVEPRFHVERQWYFREKAGKYYNWKPFAISIVLIELPFIIFCTTVFFCILYWTVGFTTNSLSTFYTYLMLVIFTIFAITLGQWIAAWTPSTQIAALLNPFIISTMNLFCGVVMPYASMPKFWRSWLYWLDPYHYIVEGLVVTQLNGLTVRCRDSEFSIFQPPAGQSCIQFAGPFMATAPGYINNPDALRDCQYCQYSKGQDFYRNLNMDFDHRWRNIGIACIFLVSNVTLVFLGIRFFKGAKR